MYFYTQCACHAGGGLALVALGSLVESLLSTSDSFTGGRPWEKSLKRRNSSQFGQCKALKASSIVFSNAFPHLTPIPIPISAYCVRADRLYSCFKFPYWSEAVRQYRQCLEEASWQNQGWSYGAATCHGRAQLLRNKLQCFAMYTTQSCCEIICIALTQGTKVPLPTPSDRFGIFLASQERLLECEFCYFCYCKIV